MEALSHVVITNRRIVIIYYCLNQSYYTLKLSDLNLVLPIGSDGDI